MKIKHPDEDRYRLEQSLADCHDWVTPDDLETIAREAFRLARLSLDHEDNWPVCKRGAGRYWMAEEIGRFMELLVHDHAYRNHVPGFTSWANSILKAWRVDIRDSRYEPVTGGVGDCHKSVINDEIPPASGTLSPSGQNIHRRASHNGTTED